MGGGERKVQHQCLTPGLHPSEEIRAEIFNLRQQTGAQRENVRRPLQHFMFQLTEEWGRRASKIVYYLAKC